MLRASPDTHSIQPHSAACQRGKQKHPRSKPSLELLESRCLMTASPNGGWDDLLSVQAGCSCPVCTGVSLSEIPQETSTPSGFAASNPLSAIPQLNSLAGATRSIYLDFNGHTQATWGGYSNAVTKVFDKDGDYSTFSADELSTITEIWARVAEDYAPFNINVTTVEPPSFANGAAVRLAIGGNWSDWFGQSAGGVAYINAFTNSAPNVGYVFSDALGGGTARYVAEAASHEAGHMFGLLHQSYWVNGQLQAEYYQGNSAWAPIMGVGYYAARTTWHNGNTNAGPTVYQDDLAILANSTNAFGYRADDFGSSLATASALAMNGGSVNFAGLIGQNNDEDWFSFSTSGGALSLNLSVAQFGANLDSVLELRNSSGGVLQTVNPTNSLGASLTASLVSGTYYVVVKSSGGYGNLGNYTLTGTVPSPTNGGGGTGGEGESGGGGDQNVTGPEISITSTGGEVADGGAVNFGTTFVGTAVNRTFTVLNTGSSTLTLSRLSTTGLPKGFTIASNLSKLSLAPGQTATFTLRFNSTTAGSFGGQIKLLSNDADEGSYELNLSGTAVQKTIKIIDNGAAGYTKSGSWNTKRFVGRDRDIDLAASTANATPTATATWNFTNLEAGSYRVHVTWARATNQASNAPFTLFDGNTALSTVLVNQKNSPSGLSVSSSTWASLGTVAITGNSLRVVLGNNADGVVAADAIRIERVLASPSSASNGALFAAASSAGATESGAAGGELAAPGLPVRAPNVQSPAARIQAAAPSAFSTADPELQLLTDAISLLEEMEAYSSSRREEATGKAFEATDWIRDDALNGLNLDDLLA